MQHELDHLDGILFLDRVESLVDDVFRRRIYADKPELAGCEPASRRLGAWALLAARGTGPSSNASAGARIG